MERKRNEEDVLQEFNEDLIKMLYAWGFLAHNIARAFNTQRSFVLELTEGVKPCAVGVCNDDGWLMEELMRMGFSKREVGLLFGQNETSIDSHIAKYHSKEIAENEDE